jgi:hypothetical protein
MLKMITFAAALVVAAAAAAQPETKLTDVTGTWVINIESHQIGLEIEQKGTTVEGTLHAMGQRIPLAGTFIDRKLELKGVREEGQPSQGAADAGPIVATMLDNGTLEGELSTNHGRMKFVGERLGKP